ncbi:MAG: methyltransferase domain-containing protein [Alphaproteobacteria bacterium]|nr:methyltransferase domain-containing protein [Alphaproteobacteria bacterium]
MLNEPTRLEPLEQGAMTTDAHTTLDLHFDLEAAYRGAYEAYRASGVDKALDPADKEFAGSEAWRQEHYFRVGADALRLIVQNLIANNRSPPSRILDFPSGSGRVTRHLRAFFPHSEIVACDLYESHIAFCAQRFAAVPYLSREHLDDLSFEGSFDLIFCGSLLTHLPQKEVEAALRLIARSLSPRGIALVTFQGRYSDHIQRNKWKYLADRLYARAQRAVRWRGFGYVDYEPSFRAVFSAQARYGVTLVRPHWVMRALEPREEIRILSYAERAWDDHQDVLVFGRPGIND